jgi:hypothetical protein
MIENKAIRYNKGKLKWSLVPMRALEPMVQVLMFGATKYSPNNWQKGMSYCTIYDSMQRHINSFMEGEDNDPDSKMHHIGHILCNALFLSWMIIFKPEYDDRNNFKPMVLSNDSTDNTDRVYISEDNKRDIHSDKKNDTLNSNRNGHRHVLVNRDSYRSGCDPTT